MFYFLSNFKGFLNKKVYWILYDLKSQEKLNVEVKMNKCDPFQLVDF